MHNIEDLKDKFWIVHNGEGFAHTGYNLPSPNGWDLISREPIVEVFETEQEWIDRKAELNIQDI